MTPCVPDAIAYQTGGRLYLCEHLLEQLQVGLRVKVGVKGQHRPAALEVVAAQLQLRQRVDCHRGDGWGGVRWAGGWVDAGGGYVGGQGQVGVATSRGPAVRSCLLAPAVCTGSVLFCRRSLHCMPPPPAHHTRTRTPPHHHHRTATPAPPRPMHCFVFYSTPPTGA